MKRDYYYINNYKNQGDLAIGRHAFERIALIAANSVIGAQVPSQNKKKMNRLFSLEGPVKASFRKDGRIDLRIDVSISKTAENIQDVCLLIQKKVGEAITKMCEALPFQIEVRVTSLTA